MNSRDAIMKALTPGDMLNQKGLAWRSIRSLGQFASVEQEDVLGLLDEHFQGLVSVRPNAKHPEHGPLVALIEYLPQDPEVGAEVQVAVVGGPAVNAPPEAGGAIDGVGGGPEIAVVLGAGPAMDAALGDDDPAMADKDVFDEVLAEEPMSGDNPGFEEEEVVEEIINVEIGFGEEVA